MSDSSIALKPVIDEPSKPIPSSSAPAISEGVIAKLFRCPSMSVNQKRTYSTPSCSICLRTALRAAGSDVARSLLSIIATIPCSSLRSAPAKPVPALSGGSVKPTPREERPQEPRVGAPEASSPQNRARAYQAGPERAAEMHPFEPALVAEPLVDAAHRRVAEVVLGAQVARPDPLGGDDLARASARVAIPRPRARRATPVIECWYVSSVNRETIPNATTTPSSSATRESSRDVERAEVPSCHVSNAPVTIGVADGMSASASSATA